MYNIAIEDAERRIGSYLCMEGTEKSDQYVQHQLKLINEWIRGSEDGRAKMPDNMQGLQHSYPER